MINRDMLRRLRVLQILQNVHPQPMSERMLLNSLRVDAELKPTIERVRKTLKYLQIHNLVETIVVSQSDWMAGTITNLGLAFLNTNAESANSASFDIYHPKTKPMPAPSNRNGRVSSITKLPMEVKAWLDQELVRRQFSGYLQLEALLAEQGYEISKSALNRYGKKFKDEQLKLKQSIEMAKAFAEVVGDDGAAMNATLTALTQQKLFEVIREGEYDDEIKLPDLVRSIASLNRSDINTRKFQIVQEARNKALNEAANAVEAAAVDQGLSAEQAQFWREKVLGVK